MDQVNYIAYMDQLHKYMFDSENLVKTLSLAPFTKVSLRDFDESVDLIIFEGDFEDIEDDFILGSLNDSSFEFELVGSISAFIFSI